MCRINVCFVFFGVGGAEIKTCDTGGSVVFCKTWMFACPQMFHRFLLLYFHN